MEYEFIKEKVDMQRKDGYRPVIKEWLESENKTLKFKCKSTAEMRRCYGACNMYRKKIGADYTIFQRSGTCEVYLIRA